MKVTAKDIEVKPAEWMSWEGVSQIKRRIADRLTAEGVNVQSWRGHMQMQAIFADLLDARPSYRERQQAWLARQPKAAPSVVLTDEERAYLLEKLQGVNDPVGRALLDRLTTHTTQEKA